MEKYEEKIKEILELVRTIDEGFILEKTISDKNQFGELVEYTLKIKIINKSKNN